MMKFGIEMQCKGSDRACLDCVWKNPVNTKSESQKVPLSSLNVQQTGTTKPVMLASSSNSSEWNNDDKWSSQVRKSGEMSKTSTMKPASDELVIDIDMDSNTATESDLALRSRSFLNSSRFHARHWQTFYELENFFCLRHWKYLKTMKRNVLLIPHLCLYSQKDFQQDVGRSSDLGQKQSGIPLSKKWPGGKWDRVAELMMIKFGESGHPVFRATSPLSRGNAQKQRRWEIIYTFLCRWWYDWNCFSHNHFCQSAQYPRSSLRFVWRVQYLSNKHRETCCGRAIRHIFAPADLLIMTPTSSIEIPAQENLLQKHKGRVENLPQPDQLIKVCTDAGFLKTVEVWTVFHDKDILTSSYNLQSQWHVVSRLYHEMTNQLTRKVGFKGTPKLDPCWKSQPVTYKVNTEWKSELNLWTNTILSRGSEIFNGLNKLVTDLIDKEYDDNEQETSTTKTEVFCVCKPIQG